MGFAGRHRPAAFGDFRDGARRNRRHSVYHGYAGGSPSSNCGGDEGGGAFTARAFADGRGVHRPYDERKAPRMRDRSGHGTDAPEDGIPRERSGATQRGDSATEEKPSVGQASEPV